MKRARVIVESIAARFGFFRPPPTELIVFRDTIAANMSGFYNGPVHPVHKHIRAWWPGQGVRGLLGVPCQRITISESMRYHSTAEGRIFDILRARQRVFGKQAMWIEL